MNLRHSQLASPSVERARLPPWQQVDEHCLSFKQVDIKVLKMTEKIEIHQINHLPSQLLTLEKEAVEEGFRFLTRLITQWNSGANRFDAPGECLMVAYLDRRLIGVGGLSVDPYAKGHTARLRRVYVAASSRGQYVGQTLIEALVAHAARHFRIVRLSTDTVAGDAFYLRCGFTRSDDEHATHTMVLSERSV